jgi:hypothetical protein
MRVARISIYILFYLYLYITAFMNFQSTVLTVAVVLLLICMILISIALVKSKGAEQWPPIIGDCPDYWIDLSGNGAQCVNMKDLGTCSSGTSGAHQQMNFTVPPYTGQNGLCAKYKWAKGCGITWDGITSGVPNPCDVSGNTTS